MMNREEYIGKMKAQLDELNAQLKKWEAKAGSAQADFTEKHADQIAKLREHYVATAAKLDELRSAGEDRWESLVAEGEKVHKAFVHSVNYFKSQLK